MSAPPDSTASCRGAELARTAAAARVVAAARACIGVPYRHLGRDPARGLDCVGLLLHAFAAAGLAVAGAPAGYGRRPQGHRLLAEVARHGRRLTLKEARPADVLAFAGSERLPCHLALVTATAPELLIVHSWAEHRRVAEHRLAGWSGGAPVGVWRLFELDAGAAARAETRSERRGLPALDNVERLPAGEASLRREVPAKRSFACRPPGASPRGGA